MFIKGGTLRVLAVPETKALPHIVMVPCEKEKRREEKRRRKVQRSVPDTRMPVGAYASMNALGGTCTRHV